MFVVAYKVPHNEGLEYGIVTGPGFAGDGLVDRYEVDAEIQSFADEAEARAWLDAEDPGIADQLRPVVGGYVGTQSY